MKYVLCALGLAVSLAACGQPFCERFCERVRDQLSSQFGMSFNCSDPKWSGTDCAQCKHVLETDYGISFMGDCPQ
jgi:hypothetical protein